MTTRIKVRVLVVDDRPAQFARLLQQHNAQPQDGLISFTTAASALHSSLPMIEWVVFQDGRKAVDYFRQALSTDDAFTMVLVGALPESEFDGCRVIEGIWLAKRNTPIILLDENVEEFWANVISQVGWTDLVQVIKKPTQVTTLLQTTFHTAATIQRHQYEKAMLESELSEKSKVTARLRRSPPRPSTAWSSNASKDSTAMACATWPWPSATSTGSRPSSSVRLPSPVAWPSCQLGTQAESLIKFAPPLTPEQSHSLSVHRQVFPAVLSTVKTSRFQPWQSIQLLQQPYWKQGHSTE